MTWPDRPVDAGDIDPVDYSERDLQMAAPDDDGFDPEFEERFWRLWRQRQSRP